LTLLAHCRENDTPILVVVLLQTFRLPSLLHLHSFIRRAASFCLVTSASSSMMMMMMMMIRSAPTAFLSRGSFRTAGQQQQARRDLVAHHRQPPSDNVRSFASGRTEASGADAIHAHHHGKVVAMVAGGASGLGAAAAKALLQLGARVVVADLNRAAFDSDPDFARYRDNDQQVLEFCHADVTNPDHVSSALDVAEATFGRTINASVCCAGIATARRTIGKTGSAHSLDEFVRVLHVNTVGTFNVARLSAERMVRGAANENDTNETNGCIVLTSSIAAYEGQVGQVAYAASKAAVVGMTLPLARDLAQHKIRVVTIVRTNRDCAVD
jgi:NAD(P)-dependent dehydrogenase (short-subunit alcohol dehydrogenase family)